MRRTATAAIQHPEPVTKSFLHIPSPDGALAAWVYRPDTPPPHPAIVSFHGGGWTLGSTDMDDYRNHELTRQSGCAIVSVNYRLAPEFPYPAALNDCYTAITWVAQHAINLGIDPTRIGVAGSSAGGNLAAASTIRSRDERGPSIAFMLLFYPVCDADLERPSYAKYGENFGLTAAKMRWFWQQYVPNQRDRKNPYVSPLRGQLHGLPRTFILVAECDPLRDEAEAFADALNATDVPTDITCYYGTVHGFLTIAPTSRPGRKAIADAAAALKAAMTCATSDIIP